MTAILPTTQLSCENSLQTCCWLFWGHSFATMNMQSEEPNMLPHHCTKCSLTAVAHTARNKWQAYRSAANVAHENPEEQMGTSMSESTLHFVAQEIRST